MGWGGVEEGVCSLRVVGLAVGLGEGGGGGVLISCIAVVV